MMSRLIIQAEDELLDRARRRAAERGVSIAQVVRDALEAALENDRPRIPENLGKFSSGFTDTAERAGNDEYVPPPWRSS
jgi:plasmid stability protein